MLEPLDHNIVAPKDVVKIVYLYPAKSINDYCRIIVETTSQLKVSLGDRFHHDHYDYEVVEVGKPSCSESGTLTVHYVHIVGEDRSITVRDWWNIFWTLISVIVATVAVTAIIFKLVELGKSIIYFINNH